MRSFTRTLAAAACAATAATLAGAANAQAPAGQAAPARPVAAQPNVATPAKPAAVVNGEPISMTDLDTVLRMAGPMPVELPADKKRAIQREALAALVDDLLFRQFLRQNGTRVDPAEVNKKLDEMKEGLKRDGKTLDDFLKHSGQTEAQVRTNLLHMLQWIAYARARVTDDQLVRYHQEFKDFFDGAAVRASHVVIRMAPDAPAAERKAAHDKLVALKAEIVAGRLDFAEAARKHSMCDSAPNGGDIGSFPRKWVVEESFARTAFAMQPNQVSDVVQTEYGLHLIKVTERTAGQPVEFSKIKDEVREVYTEDMRMALLNDLRKAARIEINIP